jgi:hypothetical protein
VPEEFAQIVELPEMAEGVAGTLPPKLTGVVLVAEHPLLSVAVTV